MLPASGNHQFLELDMAFSCTESLKGLSAGEHVSAFPGLVNNVWPS